MTKKRSEITEEDKWDLTPMFSSNEACQESIESGMEKIHKILPYKGQIEESPKQLRQVLDLTLKTANLLEIGYVYAHLQQDQDVSVSENKALYDFAVSCYHTFAAQVAWLDPEICALDDATFQTFIESEELAPYKFYLEKGRRQKKHTLGMAEEKILALSSQPISAIQKAYSMLCNVDMQFDEAVDSEGNSHPLSQGSYALYLQSKDRTLRKSAFENLHKEFASHQFAIAELLGGSVKACTFQAQARHYESGLAAKLFPNAIEEKVYKTLIETVRENLGPLHDYIQFRKKRLGVDKLHAYDLFVPLVEGMEKSYTYDEAVGLVLESVAPLGKDYTEALRKGLKEDRIVDVYECKNKRSGAYSSGTYGTLKYMLLNFHGTTRDVYTLAHEAGHSMHSHFTCKNQPLQYGSYSIFLAEIASTFNEKLLFDLLYERAESDLERAYLLDQKINDLRSTLFRQTQFAEFELYIHDQIEQNLPLTAETMKEAYCKLNRDYYGEAIEIDDSLAIEWARIPHFYSDFYVYQYATGISAAYAFADHVEKRDGLDQYLGFLSAGCSDYPCDILKKSGIDMTQKEPVKILIDYFSELVERFKKLNSSL
ncbi:MAG: Oligoendopeptidase F, plasmid [Chlamydiia bacterium]|nr:Oligoendopeptidase F, plasmid [Chlamydiia bacterium]